MRRHVALVLLAISFAFVVVAPSPVGAGVPPPAHTLRLWMMPPVDALGNNACFTNRWHGGEAYDDKALDWKATCGSVGLENVYWRSLGADLYTPNDGTTWTPLYAVGSNLTPYNCDSGDIHTAKVKVYDLLGNVHNFIVYVHALAITGQGYNVFDIWVKNGATKSTAYLQNRIVGYTTMDGDADAASPYFTDCWKGWHVHENNSIGSPWDGWNSKWTTAALNANYSNSNRNNWTRQMTLVYQPGE